MCRGITEWAAADIVGCRTVHSCLHNPVIAGLRRNHLDCSLAEACRCSLLAVAGDHRNLLHIPEHLHIRRDIRAVEGGIPGSAVAEAKKTCQ